MLRRTFLKILGISPVVTLLPKKEEPKFLQLKKGEKADIRILDQNELKIRDRVEIRVWEDSRWKSRFFDQKRYKEYKNKVRTGTIEKVNTYIATEDNIEWYGTTIQKSVIYCIKVDGIDEVEVFYGKKCLTKIS